MMRMTTGLRLFLFISMVFLAVGCGNVKSPGPVRTDPIPEADLPKAPPVDKKTTVDVPDEQKEKTDSEPVQKALAPPREPAIYETGIASFYADMFQSRKTASGERFDQKAQTAAHKQLPFGTRVKVTNTKNKKSIIVTINDRGPFVKGRIIDLSKFAFSRIGKLRDGLLDVQIQIIETDGATPDGPQGG